jgi:hypothetical protein
MQIEADLQEAEHLLPQVFPSREEEPSAPFARNRTAANGFLHHFTSRFYDEETQNAIARSESIKIQGKR